MEMQHQVKGKYAKIIYWISTAWLSLGMLSTGVVQLIKMKEEWAYAGFFFVMSGAVFSHMALGDGAKDFFGPILLIVLTIVSWYFRPVDRKIN